MDFLERLSMQVPVLPVTYLDQAPPLCGPQPSQSFSEGLAGIVSKVFSALEIS